MVFIRNSEAETCNKEAIIVIILWSRLLRYVLRSGSENIPLVLKA